MKQMKTFLSRIQLVAALAALSAQSAPRAFAATLPHVFGDSMVLQRERPVPVWGKGEPGERVTVSFAGRRESTVVGDDGRWRVNLPPLEANAEGSEFRVAGNGAEIVFTNVVVGEVWFCSGQSNMEFTMSARRKVKDWEREVAAANWPLIRHFRVAHKVSSAPLDDVDASWQETTPQTIPPQSAVAFFFGETLHRELGVPVGLINCSWGGTRIEPWTPAGHPDDLWLLQNIKTWGRPQDVPTVLWNGMVSGLVPFAIRGAIWYQGCANRMDGAQYLDKTVSLVRGWRREWGQGDFPYFLVQLAPYKYDSKKGTTLAALQMAQARVPDVVPNSGYVVINDVGDVDDIHPTDKRTVGTRLADQALDRVYGKFVRPWKSPVAKSMRAEGSRVRVSFENAEGLTTRDGLPPTEFEIRDIAGAWVPAAAEIDGHDVVLSAEGVETPLGVRFAPYNGSTPNLVNEAGLPAGPFVLGNPCPLGAAERIPLSDGWKCVQRYDIPECCDLRRAVPTTIASVQDVSRVGYLLELQDAAGDTSFAFAGMDAFATDSDALVLRGQTKGPDLRVAVSNLVVVSNSDALPRSIGGSGGVVEFFYSNYSPRTNGEPKGGDPRKYDFDDTPTPDAVSGLGYGCLQIHDAATGTTVLAFNNFNKTGQPCDVGIGKCHGENPDWTFAHNGGNYRARRISVWVK